MIKIIAALTPSRVIGNKGSLPWTPKDVPGELKWFQEATLGHTVIMGRTTWESLPLKHRPLSGRENIVVSRKTQELDIPGVFLAQDLEEALNRATSDKDIWVIGGAQLYTTALPVAHELYLTILDHEFEGDTLFPEYERLFMFAGNIRQGEGWTVKKFIKGI